jgi:threonine synthase
MSYVTKLKCIDCGREYPAEMPAPNCTECSKKGFGWGLLDPVYDYDKIAEKISVAVLESRKPGVWKYKEFLPVSNESKIVSLYEGGTPLLTCPGMAREFNISNLRIKNETVNPTFSFKDRAFTVMVSRSNEMGASTNALVSDGNAGSAAAAYSARAGIPCYVITPPFAVNAKLTQMTMYGAKVFEVNGSLIDAGMLTIEACAKYGWSNITTAKVLNPYSTEGHKTIAYEICEQLGWKAPDWVISPVASGDSLGAMWKGFKEFHKLGLIKNLPRMVGVQGEGAAPLVMAFEGNKQFYEIEQFEPKTIADALCIGGVVGSWALTALRESKGCAVEVSDAEILAAQKKLAAGGGIFVEPSSAATCAGLIKLLNKKVIGNKETVVCVTTGSGLKVIEVAAKMCEKPVKIESNIQDLEKALADRKK